MNNKDKQDKVERIYIPPKEIPDGGKKQIVGFARDLAESKNESFTKH